MNKTQAQISIKSLNKELFSLTPSSVITLFEIDVSALASDLNIALANDYEIFRFHNNIKLINTNIIWQGNTYIAAPITAEGFEINSKGTLPSPRLGISVNDAGIEALAVLKETLRQLEDLVGAKVTRKKTLAKFLDAENFVEGNQPPGFSPDPNAEFSRDIYYIDRKIVENKSVIEFQLASILDLEGLQLPRRRILEKKCTWTYRGEGCLYEYENNAFSHRIVAEHGKATESDLPTNAPPVATANDELISDIIGKEVNSARPFPYDPNKSYSIGDVCYIQKNNIKYYFVAKINNPTLSPPNSVQWIADQCSLSCRGCKLRWNNSKNPIGNGSLPAGFFLAVNRVQ